MVYAHPYPVSIIALVGEITKGYIRVLQPIPSQHQDGLTNKFIGEP